MRMRKKRRCAQRMAALSALFVKAEPLSGEIFDEKKPLRLEIGCGKGDFIVKLSERDREYNYIALEKVEDVAVVAVEKYAKSRSLGSLDGQGAWVNPEGERFDGTPWDIPLFLRGNVRFMCADAANITEYFPEESLDAIYANFSDPWPKKGYHNRRLTHPDFLKRYLKILKKGGTFTFKTDNRDLFEFSVEALEGEEGFDVTFITRDLHKSERRDSNIMTEYERNFSEQGVNINCIEAVKK